MASKAKAKVRKAKVAKAKATPLASFGAGDRVKVLAGDWGNACGTVQGIDARGLALVRMDNDSGIGPHALKPELLVLLA